MPCAMLRRRRGGTTGQPTQVGLLQGPAHGRTRRIPEVIPLLQAMEAKQQRLHASLDGSVDAIVTATQDDAKTAGEKQVWPAAMYCCITDDIREALGVGPRQFPWTMFLLRFVEWCRVVERNATRRVCTNEQRRHDDQRQTERIDKPRLPPGRAPQRPGPAHSAAGPAVWSAAPPIRPR